MSTPANLATAEEFQAEIARLQAEINRLRLTDAEREAAATLRSLLERLGVTEPMTKQKRA